MSIADEEPIMTEPFQKFVELTQRYANSKLAVESQVFSGETHNTTTLQGQYHGLKHLFSGWATSEKTPQTFADLQATFAWRSTLLGTPLVIPEDKAAGYAQWLQYLNRKEDALALLDWNRKTYPQSFNAHVALISAYAHFKLPDAAKAAWEEAVKSLHGLSAEQTKTLQGLVSLEKQ